MGGDVGRWRERRALRGRGAPYRMGVLCCGVSLFGFAASAYALGPDSPSTYGQPALGGTPSSVGSPYSTVPTTGGTPGAPGAQAGPPILLIPSVSVGETFNDNVNLSPKGQAQSDFITTVSPGLNLAVQGSRVKLNLNYNPQELFFARGTSPDQIQQRLQGAGHSEIVPEMLFFDANVSADQEFINNTGPIGSTTLTTNNNLQTVYAETATPYLLQHFGPYMDSETRYRFSSVSTSGAQVAPQTIHEGLQRFTGGEFFGRLSWAVTADWNLIQRGISTNDAFSSTDSKSELARADFRYPVYEALSIIGGAGYEKIIDPTLLEQPSGLIWNAGFQYQPNPKILYTLTYGRRFNQTDIELHSTHQVTPRLTVNTLYSKTIQTGQSQLAANLGQLIAGPNGTFINSQTGQIFVLGNTTSGRSSSAFGITSGSFLQTRSEADATFTSGRNSYFATVYDVKETSNSGTIASEKIRGGSVTWNRQLWPDLTSNLGGSYNRDTFEDGIGRIDDFYSAFFGLAYNFGPDASANMLISRSDTESNIATNSVENDIITVSLRKQF